MKQKLNLKGFYLTVLMSLVDAEHWFIWTSAGAPVNTHVSTLLQSTDLWKIFVKGEMIPNAVQHVEDIEIPPLILGDRAFPLWTFILKRHRDTKNDMIINDILSIEIVAQD